MDYAEHHGEFAIELSDAQLMHLIVGQTLYLRDPRNTPVEVMSCEPATASFSARVSDFEDIGAEWVLPLWDVSKFRVATDAPQLSTTETAVLIQHSEVFDLVTEVPINPGAREATEVEIARCQNEIIAALDHSFPDLPTNASALISGKVACGKWSNALESVMNLRGLQDIDRVFATQYASNPHAGEFIKGHRMVFAELGLVPYRGHIVRDPRTFEEQWAKPRRRKHILTRLAFMRTMLSRLGMASVPLYRTIYSDTELRNPENRGFVSTTFCRDVAASLFASGQKMRVSASYWQRVANERVFMSYFETPELSRRFQEAEAVLIFDELNPIF